MSRLEPQLLHQAHLVNRIELMINKYLKNATIVHSVTMVAYLTFCRIIYDRGGQDDPVGNSIRVWLFFVAHVIVTNFVVVARYNSLITLPVRLVCNNGILSAFFVLYIFLISALLSNYFNI